MPTTTPINGWTVPVSTDLVKDGAVAIETLGDAIDASVGSGLLAWLAYTPTLTGVTIGNGTLSFAYCQIGKTVHVRGSFTLGTTSAITGSITMTAPVATIAASAGNVIGHLLFVDQGAAAYQGIVRNTNTAAFTLSTWNVAATYPVATVTSATIPFTWGSTDSFQMYATYQAA